MIARHQALAGAVREQISRYQSYVKEHQDFNSRHSELVRCMEEDVANRLDACREIVGDYKILQERRIQLDALQERRNELDRQLEALSELAERLYVHTGPDGREMLRVQLKVIRERWEEICDDLTSTASKLDECLQKFAQFSAGQEQLTRWLRDVEQSMQQHSDLKSTLQEKRAQLQSHRIVHQEILGHHQLVDQVCQRAQELIDETLDKSLEVYITSIRQLFTSICAKSVELMGRLETCVTDHAHHRSTIKSVQDWIGSLRDETRLLCDSLAGEKTETAKPIRGMEELRLKREPAGRKQLEELSQLCSTVLTSTSPRGCDLVAKTLTGLNDEMDSVSTELQDGLKTQQGILQRWQSFDDGLEAMNAWLKTQQEAALGDQPLQVTLADKEARLAHLQAVRDVITSYEPQIDAFVDQATTLLQTSGVERLRAPVALVSSRYQQLHVASQEVVSKWRGLVEDHRLCNYIYLIYFLLNFLNFTTLLNVFSLLDEDKFFETVAWLTSLEDVLVSLLNKDNEGTSTSSHQIGVQNLMAEKEQASHRLGSLTSAGERLFPETASVGREKIRQDLKLLRARWEELERRLSAQHKNQEQQLQRLSSYQDGLVQIGIWIDTMEKCVASDQSAQQAATTPEIRSHMLKLKAHLQEVASHRRQVEALKERARLLVEDLQQPTTTASPKESQEIQRTIGDISHRYDVLSTGLQNSVANCEWLLDALHQHNDLEKAQNDWQQQAWAQLNSNADYGGSKHALKLRCSKVLLIN